MKYLLVIAMLLPMSIILAQSQEKLTISGYVEDGETGEKLIGANVIDAVSKMGTTTNLYGFYSITLPLDSVKLSVSFIGFKSQGIELYLNEHITYNFSLKHNNLLEEISLNAEEGEPIEESTQMSTIDIPIKQIKKLPALMGEVDVMKAMQLLPGVQSGSEGSSGLYVRGGGPDQNLILLDGAPVYNASHLFGFFSVFNADAINSVSLMKGGFPARYGGRLSSVMEINMKEGNMKKFQGEGSIGLIASKLTFQGPIKKDTTSFIISARRTYVDLLMRPITKALLQGQGSMGYYFYDVNAKVNHRFSDKDRIYFSVYTGQDKFYVKVEDGNAFNLNAGLNWGNTTSTLRWNHLFTQKLFMNAMATYSKCQFSTGYDVSYLAGVDDVGNNINAVNNLKYLSGIVDYSAKIDFDYLPSPNHYVKFGTNAIHHTFDTGALHKGQSYGDENQLDTIIGVGNTIAYEISSYIEDDIKITDRLKTNIGVHLSSFMVKDKLYPSIQPRISSRYMLTDQISAKASFAVMRQYIHLLSNSGIGLPTDLWVPATDRVLPQQSYHAAGGLAHTRKIKGKSYEVSLEGYYKKMDNIISFKEGADFIDPNQDWQDKVEMGKGWSYGAEFFVQKKTGKMTGWIGYTLSWSNRQFENINSGKIYPYKYDRRNDLSVVVAYEINDHIDIAGTWVFGTGNATSLPIARYEAHPDDQQSNSFFDAGNVDYYNGKNGFRMAAYHRMDLGVNFRKEKKWGERVWNFSVYNAYNRKNPFFYYINGTGTTKQVSLFPILPSASYHFKF